MPVIAGHVVNANVFVASSGRKRVTEQVVRKVAHVMPAIAGRVVPVNVSVASGGLGFAGVQPIIAVVMRVTAGRVVPAVVPAESGKRIYATVVIPLVIVIRNIASVGRVVDVSVFAVNGLAAGVRKLPAPAFVIRWFGVHVMPVASVPVFV
jgi:hypothetical protein